MNESRHQRIVRVAEVATAAIVIPIAWLELLTRWLVGSALGGLVLAGGWYWYLWRFGASKPFTPAQLLAWFAAQPYEVKLGIGGGLLTLAGFAIAFWTAAATWRSQKELELRIEASKAIHTRFSRAIRLLNEISAYLFILTDALRAVTPEMPEGLKAARLAYSNARAVQFSQLKQQLYAAMLDIYDLHGEYASIFANVISVSTGLRNAEAAIKAAQDKLGPLVPPYADPNTPNFAATFLSRCNLPLFDACHSACVEAREMASMLYGRSAGALVSRIIRPNFIGLLSASRMGRIAGRIFIADRIKRRAHE